MRLILAMFLIVLATAVPVTSAQEAAITAVEAEFAAAWAAHDPGRMASFWAEDGDLMNPFGRFARGRGEVEALFAEEQAGLMRSSTYHFRLDSARAIAPGIVVTDWTNTIRGMVAPDGTALPPFEHHVTTVFVERDGRWMKAAARSVALLSPPPAVPPR